MQDVPAREVIAHDCVEFNPDLRRIDVAADMAFLVMDLARLGAESSAWQLIEAYRRTAAIRGTTRCSRSSPPIAPGCDRRWGAPARWSSKPVIPSAAVPRPRRVS